LARANIDPRIANIFIDSCAFDPKYSPEDTASEALFKLSQEEQILLIIAHSNQKEIEHPNTPSWVKKEAQSRIYTIVTSLTDDEQRIKSRILSILAGNGKPENMRQDAEYVYEASKYGSYFVTTDERILKRKKELFESCTVTILKPSEILRIYQEYTGAQLKC
jgi:transposase